MQRVLKEKCFLNVGILGTMPFDKLARRAARSFTPIIVEYPRSQPSKAIHQMLAAILLDRDQRLDRDDLLQKTNLMRSEAKDQIRSETMTLDGLTISQINTGRINDKSNKQHLRPGTETSPKFSKDFEHHDNLNKTGNGGASAC
jgi:hypothetical protein